jgi:hypothetical protein
MRRVRPNRGHGEHQKLTMKRMRVTMMAGTGQSFEFDGDGDDGSAVIAARHVPMSTRQQG